MRGDRKLELHLRFSLGLVTYRIGPEHVSHENYMAELGVSNQSAYPGYSEEPLDGFKRLRDDLSRYATDFLSGDGQITLRAARAERAAEVTTNEQGMADAIGDTRKREEAKELFRKRDWAGVVALLESLEYPHLLSKAERTRLDLARRKTTD